MNERENERKTAFSNKQHQWIISGSNEENAIKDQKEVKKKYNERMNKKLGSFSRAHCIRYIGAECLSVCCVVLCYVYPRKCERVRARVRLPEYRVF